MSDVFSSTREAKSYPRVICTNFGLFHGHTSWVLYRLTRFEIELGKANSTRS
jgi:hypothetical protein